MIADRIDGCECKCKKDLKKKRKKERSENITRERYGVRGMLE